MSLKTQTAFSKLSELCEKVVATTKRLEKMSLVGEFIAKLLPEEVEAAALLIIGQPFPRASHRVLAISWAALYDVLKEMFKPSTDEIGTLFRESGDLGEVVRRLYLKSGRVAQATLFPTPLTITEVYQTFTVIADVQGTGSRRRKTGHLRSLFMHATPLEAKYLTKILLGDQRIGFNEGMLEGTIARAFNLPLPLVQRANMLTGDLGKVTRIAREEGITGLQKVRLQSFTPLLPMLAAQAKDVSEALLQHGGESAFEMKLDGARV
ncbi:MAG: DNA ligase, partial [Promethearchaeota archaeon]